MPNVSVSVVATLKRDVALVPLVIVHDEGRVFIKDMSIAAPFSVFQVKPRVEMSKEVVCAKHIKRSSQICTKYM